jgi:hypothetical protein
MLNQNTTFLMQNVFCPEGGVGPNEVPSVAVTEHGIGVGPAFYGVRKVRKLYSRLFSAFPDVQMLALNAPPLLLASQDGNTIAVQTTLTSTHQDWWFAKADGDKFYSKPLPDIPPNAGVIIDPRLRGVYFQRPTSRHQLSDIYGSLPLYSSTGAHDSDPSIARKSFRITVRVVPRCKAIANIALGCVRVARLLSARRPAAASTAAAAQKASSRKSWSRPLRSLPNGLRARLPTSLAAAR